MNASSPVRSAATSSLLDPAESALKARPLRSWQTVNKEMVRARLDAVYQAWSHEWLPRKMIAAPLADLEVTETDDTLAMAAGGMVCWSFVETSRRTVASTLDAPSRNSRDSTASAQQALAERMFAFDLASSISALSAAMVASALVRAAWADWLQRLSALWPGVAFEPQQPGLAKNISSDTWSGTLYARWPWCGGTWCLGLSYDVVLAMLGSDGAAASAPSASTRILPKERLDQALSAEPVMLRVMLEGAELKLGQLHELRLDDVVPLAHLLDAPALVTAADGTPICHGWLGQNEGRMAVELAPRTPNVEMLKEKTP